MRLALLLFLGLVIVCGSTDGEVMKAAPALPKMIELGADKCVPCKMMTPILAELKKEYSGQFEVIFIDVWKNQEAAEQYDVSVIPTQVFLSAEGKELFRHQGFFPKKDILEKWADLGVKLTTKAEGPTAGK